MNDFNSDLWLTENCNLCMAVNHIFLCNPDGNAWQCWCCGEIYAIYNDIKKVEVVQGYNERF